MSYTILVVDDEIEIVRLLQETLRQEGHNVIVGYDGQMAVKLAQTRQPDLIIMDVQMPMTNGLKALEFIRKNPTTQHIPIMFLTGAPSDMVYAAVDEVSRVTFVKKPLDIEAMVPLANQLLARYGSPQPL